MVQGTVVFPKAGSGGNRRDHRLRGLSRRLGWPTLYRSSALLRREPVYDLLQLLSDVRIARLVVSRLSRWRGCRRFNLRTRGRWRGIWGRSREMDRVGWRNGRRRGPQFDRLLTPTEAALPPSQAEKRVAHRAG
jgi:hypothetical protein